MVATSTVVVVVAGVVHLPRLAPTEGFEHSHRPPLLVLPLVVMVAMAAAVA
jgi:hypothetical protein